VRVLLIRVQRRLPRDLLRLRVDLHRAAQIAHRGQHVPGNRTDRTVRGERHPGGPAAAVLDHRLVGPQVKDDDH